MGNNRMGNNRMGNSPTDNSRMDSNPILTGVTATEIMVRPVRRVWLPFPPSAVFPKETAPLTMASIITNALPETSDRLRADINTERVPVPAVKSIPTTDVYPRLDALPIKECITTNVFLL